MQKWIRTAAVFSVAALMTASMAYAAPKNTSSSLYLIQAKDGAHAADVVKGLGFSVQDNWENINAVSARMTEQQAAALSNNPNIAVVEQDAERHIMSTFNDALPITWGLDAVNAPEAWNLGATGQGIKVCILDTGIDYNHPEFFKNGVSIIKDSKNFVLDGHPDATDGNHHGTHVAGTIAAQGAYVKGVAPDVSLYIGRVLDDSGSGTSSAIMNGVNWCYSTIKANIISMSLGGSRYVKTEDSTYTKAYQAGTLTIAAAGNNGDTSVSYPAGYTNVVSIAAVDANLAHASFSQANSDVELSGPGVHVLSSVPRGTGLKGAASEGATNYTAQPVEYAPTGNVSGQLVECGIADTTTSCTGIPTSGAWIAMVDRGTINFSTKAQNVMAQGASAMLLANNDTAAPDDSGNFTFGSAGTWLPTVSVSYNSGVAIRNGGLSTGNVTISAWDYAYFDGTSMATPHVSAVAALAWSAKPTLTNAQIRTILENTAMDLGTAGRDNTFGYGLVQADKAVNQAKITN